ncbi:hypothetical protein U1Q18_014394, partial [Sarracenia purpurea var. burkii]
IDLENPLLDVTPSPLAGYTSASPGSKDALCERIKVAGQSRLKLWSYASAYHVTLAPFAIPERLHNKIMICFHLNASRGLCQCENDEWKSVHKGIWSSIMSPYDNRYVDVKFAGEFSGSVQVTVEEGQEFISWHLSFIFYRVVLDPLMIFVCFYGLCRVYVVASSLSCIWFCFIDVGTSSQPLESREESYMYLVFGSVL